MSLCGISNLWQKPSPLDKALALVLSLAWRGVHGEVGAGAGDELRSFNIIK